MTGDDGTKVLPSRSEGLEAKSYAKVLVAVHGHVALGRSMAKLQTGYWLCPAIDTGRGGPSTSMISLKALAVRRGRRGGGVGPGGCRRSLSYEW